MAATPRYPPWLSFLLDLDRGIAGRTLHQPIDMDAWGRDLLGRQGAEFGDVLGLDDRQLRRRRHHRVEVPAGLAIDEVAPAVGAPRFDQRDIALDRVFEDVFPAVEDARLLAGGELGAGGGGRVEGGNTGGRRAEPPAHPALPQGL